MKIRLHFFGHKHHDHIRFDSVPRQVGDSAHHRPRCGYPQEVRRVLVIVLCFNWLVALFKVVAGLMLNSASMQADGYHSFADGASNIIGLFGIARAAAPSDKEHPYGHKKYETFTSVLVACLLFLICFHLLHDGLERFKTNAVPQVNLFGLGVMSVTIIVNAATMAYEFRRGRRLGSDILVADAMHTRADILTSFSVLGVFLGVRLGFVFLDSLVAVLIVVFIGRSAIDILRQSSGVLCDTAVIDEKDIEAVVTGVPGVKKCHRIRTRGRTDDIHMDLHVLVDDRTPLVEAHEMSSKIEEILKQRFAGLTDVVVHIEPLSSLEH